VFRNLSKREKKRKEKQFSSYSLKAIIKVSLVEDIRSTRGSQLFDVRTAAHKS
jgi:3-mercaptopyruvate sulfurtransferase SseA